MRLWPGVHSPNPGTTFREIVFEDVRATVPSH
jgi:hypothetical protein